VKTIIFENTNFKSEKMFKGIETPAQTSAAATTGASLQMPQLGFHPVPMSSNTFLRH
jgi:hypothetical protein